METLKEKYNKLLESYKTGSEFIIKDPEGEKVEKAKAKLEKISKEMEEVLKQIPDATDEEITNGFDLPESISIDNVVEVLESELKEEPIENVSQETKIVQVQPTQQTSALQSFADDWKIATQLAKSSILPKEYQGHPENVLLAMGMSRKTDIDLITVTNNLRQVNGNLEWKGSFISALIEKSGKYKDMDFVYIGEPNTDEWGCYMEATRIRDGKKIKGTTITIKMSKAEGWYNRNKKWETMPEQMLLYRAASFFGRAYASEALNGLFTEGETIDVQGAREQPKDIL